MRKEHIGIAIIGMLLLSYMLDAVVDPLPHDLAQPYQYVTGANFTQYPFSSASIIIRALAIFMIPLLLLSYLRMAHFARGGILLIIAVLLQLYAIQQVATNSQVVPLEWAISFAIAGAALLIPAIFAFVRGMLTSAHHKMLSAVAPYDGEPHKDEAPDWLAAGSRKK